MGELAAGHARALAQVKASLGGELSEACRAHVQAMADLERELTEERAAAEAACRTPCMTTTVHAKH